MRECRLEECFIAEGTDPSAPVSQLPVHPALDIVSRFALGPEVCVLLAAEVGDDGVGLPQVELAILQGGDLAVGVHLQESLGLVLSLAEVKVDDLHALSYLFGIEAPIPLGLLTITPEAKFIGATEKLFDPVLVVGVQLGIQI